MAAIKSLAAELPATPAPIFDLPEHESFSGRDRRAAPRALRPFAVRLLADGEVLAGLDLSFGGLSCVCTEPVWPGNAIDLELLLPGQSVSVVARARVVELVSKDDQIAMRLRFEGVTAPQKKRIARWVSEL
jgi:hypothetical protein